MIWQGRPGDIAKSPDGQLWVMNGARRWNAIGGWRKGQADLPDGTVLVRAGQ